ncbi:MAG: hypothetical protein JRI68_19335 [Deltaproteobacteria bacterium]|nr:hypothetical protein [Deltaproteobacteria bacterium]
MRIVLFLFALCCVLLAGCKRSQETSDETASDPSPATGTQTAAAEPRAQKIAVGDLVVARWLGKSFYEGKAEKVTDQRVTVAWSDGSTPQDVDRADVMSVPKLGVMPDVKKGDLVLAKWTGTLMQKWYGAEILSVEAGVVKVRYLVDGVTENLAPSKVVVPPPPIVADLREQQKQLAILVGAMTAGKPRQPADWKPTDGDRVVALWLGLGWFSGLVTAVQADGTVTVSWDDGTGVGKAPPDKVAPEPKAGDALPAKGTYVVVRPEIQARVWPYAQVDGIEGDQVKVRLTSGETRLLGAADVLPFEQAAPTDG